MDDSRFVSFPLVIENYEPVPKIFSFTSVIPFVHALRLSILLFSFNADLSILRGIHFFQNNLEYNVKHFKDT